MVPMPPLVYSRHCLCLTEEEVEASLGTVGYPGSPSQKEVRPEFKARSGFRLPDGCVLPKPVHLCFRQLCQRRWASCQAFPVVLGTQTWRQYYFCRSELEFRVESGRPQDFICKAISGHTGMNWTVWELCPLLLPCSLPDQVSGYLASQLMPVDGCRSPRCYVICVTSWEERMLSPPQ